MLFPPLYKYAIVSPSWKMNPLHPISLSWWYSSSLLPYTSKLRRVNHACHLWFLSSHLFWPTLVRFHSHRLSWTSLVKITDAQSSSSLTSEHLTQLVTSFLTRSPLFWMFSYSAGRPLTIFLTPKHEEAWSSLLESPLFSVDARGPPSIPMILSTTLCWGSKMSVIVPKLFLESQAPIANCLHNSTWVLFEPLILNVSN